jgi:hypothetical protein
MEAPIHLGQVLMFRRVTLLSLPADTGAISLVKRLPARSHSKCRVGDICFPPALEEEYCRALILGSDRVLEILPEGNLPGS